MASLSRHGQQGDMIRCFSVSLSKVKGTHLSRHPHKPVSASQIRLRRDQVKLISPAWCTLSASSCRCCDAVLRRGLNWYMLSIVTHFLSSGHFTARLTSATSWILVARVRANLFDNLLDKDQGTSGVRHIRSTMTDSDDLAPTTSMVQWSLVLCMPVAVLVTCLVHRLSAREPCTSKKLPSQCVWSSKDFGLETVLACKACLPSPTP